MPGRATRWRHSGPSRHMLPAAKVGRRAGGMLMWGSKAWDILIAHCPEDRGKATHYTVRITPALLSGGGILFTLSTVPCAFAECHDAPACRRFHVGPAGCSMFADAKGVSRRVAAGGGRIGSGGWQAGSKLA